MTSDEALAAAWTHCAPNHIGEFPNGFWPDVARVAMAMFEQQSTNPILSFRPTKCERGSHPEPSRSIKSLKGVDLSQLRITI